MKEFETRLASVKQMIDLKSDLFSIFMKEGGG